MYLLDDYQRSARRGPDGLGNVSPDVRARHAVARVRQFLADAPPGLSLTPALLFPALNMPLAEPLAEAERCFALGWLHWLAGQSSAAEPLMALAADRLAANTPEGIQAAYWLARVRLTDRPAEALASFEKVLRSAQGTPLATCCFVDLLWRGGRGERAEQVWKSVRVNKRVTGCDAAFLQEARFQIRQGDLAEAERALQDAVPRGALAQGERLLLLAWLAAGKRQTEAARGLLEKARAGVLPAPARNVWRALFARKFGTVLIAEEPAAALGELGELPLSEPARRYVEAQENRADRPAAVAALRAALASSFQPYVRYALACLGEEDFAALLAGMPGNFLAPRCRLWVSLHRFCRREIGADELLTALNQAGAAGYFARGLEDWTLFVRNCATASAADLYLDAGNEPRAVSDLNRGRMYVDLVLRRMTPDQALATLLQWPDNYDTLLAQQVGRQLLRLLLTRPAENTTPTTEAVQAAAQRLLGTSSLPDVVAGLLNPADAASVAETQPEGLAERLWRRAVRMARGEPEIADGDEDPPDGIGAVLDRCLRILAAVRRGDLKSQYELLQSPCPWTLLAAGAPGFVARALHGVNAGTSSDRWREIVTLWLRNWPVEKLSGDVRRLAEHLGIAAPDPASASPPQGTAPREWTLHQAARAIVRGDAAAARDLLHRVPAGPEPLIAEALPQLERLARVQWLAAAAQLDASHPLYPPALCADLSELLAELPETQDLFAAAAGKDVNGARQHLARLADRDNLPPRLAHHLAVIYYRAACEFDDRDADAAESCWRRSWRCWLTWAAAQPKDELQSADAATPVLFHHLLEIQRKRMSDLLARGDMDRSRRRWDLIGQLPALAPTGHDALRAFLVQLLTKFRDDLATEYLLATRETMRHGAAAEGWRADYEQGLTWLRRLLSLDKNDQRMLTALVEICGDWFLDLYDTQDAERLRQEVERYTPFAMQLARAVARGGEARSEELPARAALSEFFKFRGFVSDDRDRKKELYRAALEFNPANENVRTLLKALEG